MKQKPATSYGTNIRYPKGISCITMFVITLVLLFSVIVNHAQDAIPPTTPIPPPADYMQSCVGNNLMLEHFGPNCLNPVHWDLDGFKRIGTWVFFVRDDGTTDGGVIVGFTWQHQEDRYHYYLMTQMPNPDARFGGRFEHIPPEKLMD